MAPADRVSSESALGPDALVGELFSTTEGRRFPYRIYEQFRETSPVFRSAFGGGTWMLFRYEDCWASVRDPRFGKDYERQMGERFGANWTERPSLAAGRNSIVNLNGPAHSRQRKLVSKGFTPRNINKLHDQVRSRVNDLIAPMADAGGGCLIEELAFPLPVAVIGEMLGVPESAWKSFRDLVLQLTGAFEMAPTEEQLAAADAAQVELDAYFSDLLDHKRRSPDGLMLSRMAETEVDGDRFTDAEVARLAQLLFIGGFETTTNLVGNAMMGFMRFPDQMDLLRRDPSLYDNLSDELLRYDGTVQMTSRVALTDVEFGDVTIRAGEQVMPMIASGNRDPAQFDDPDALDVTRSDSRPLSFGGGAHFCLGAHLARLEVRAVFEELFGAFDEIAFEGDTPNHRDRLVLRGLESCRLTLRSTGTRRAVAAETVERRAPKQRSTPDSGLRPVGGSGEADITWRASLRESIESTDTGVPRAPGQDAGQVVSLLAAQPVFRECTPEELQDLAATSYVVAFEPGDLLTAEGAASNECYVIDEGRAVVTVGRAGQGFMEEGDVVGERGVILDKARAATVTATTHMLTYAISRERLRRVVESNENARRWMQAEMERRYPDAP